MKSKTKYSLARRKVKIFLDENRYFGIFIVLLIVLSSVSALVQLLHEFGGGIRLALEGLEILTVTVFIVEYLFRVWSSGSGWINRFRFAFRLYSIIDIVAILSAFNWFDGTGVFISLRLLRLIKLGRYVRDIANTLEQISWISASELTFKLMLLFGGVFAVFTFGGLIKFLIDYSDGTAGQLFESIWWSFLRITDPGYLGEDANAGVRFLALILTMTGVLGFGLFVGIISSELTENLVRIRSGKGMMNLKNHIIICGWNNDAPYVINELTHFGEQVGMLAELPNRPQILDDFGTSILYRSGNPTDIEDLRKTNLKYAKTVILLRDDSYTGTRYNSDARNVLTILSIRDYEKTIDLDDRLLVCQRESIQIIAEVTDPDNEKHVLNSGADDVVLTGRLTSNFLATCVVSPGVDSVYEELLTHVGQEIYLIRVPQNMLNREQSFDEIQKTLQKEQMLLIGMRFSGKVIINPAHEDLFTLNVDDRLAVIARRSSVRELI